MIQYPSKTGRTTIMGVFEVDVRQQIHNKIKARSVI